MDIYKVYAKINKDNIVTNFIGEKYKRPNDGLILVDDTNTNKNIYAIYKSTDSNGLYNYEIKNGVLVERDKTAELQQLKTANYKNDIIQLIRQRYSLSDELAIQRQRDTKPQEFAEYNAYCEECKQQVKNKLLLP